MDKWNKCRKFARNGKWAGVIFSDYVLFISKYIHTVRVNPFAALFIFAVFENWFGGDGSHGGRGSEDPRGGAVTTSLDRVGFPARLRQLFPMAALPQHSPFDDAAGAFLSARTEKKRKKEG